MSSFKYISLLLIILVLHSCNSEKSTNSKRNIQDTIVKISLSKVVNGLGGVDCDILPDYKGKVYKLGVLVENFDCTRYEHRLIIESFVFGLVKARVKPNEKNCVIISFIEPGEYDKKHKDEGDLFYASGNNVASFAFENGVFTTRRYYKACLGDSVFTGIFDTATIKNDYFFPRFLKDFPKTG